MATAKCKGYISQEGVQDFCHQGILHFLAFGPCALHETFFQQGQKHTISYLWLSPLRARKINCRMRKKGKRIKSDNFTRSNCEKKQYSCHNIVKNTD